MFADLTRTRAALVAENALPRQQRIMLQRQAKRLVLTSTGRCRLDLLARLTCG